MGEVKVSAVGAGMGWRSSPLLSAILGRTGAGLGSFLVVTALIFVTVGALPGDVVAVVLGTNADPERAELIRASLALDKPLGLRYADWLGGFLSGDFGVSTAALAQGQALRVWQDIAAPLRNTAILGGLGLAMFLPLSVGLGVWAAFHPGGLIDRVATAFVVAIAGTPEFLVGTFLVVIFFSWLGWLPPVTYLTPEESPFSSPASLVLPVLTVLAPCLAFGVRMVRAAVAEVLRQDYVGMAHLNGYASRRILYRYVLRNALAPLLQALALVLKFMIGGLVVIETMYAYPGVGGRLVQAVATRDIQEATVIAALLAGAYIAVNVIADVASTMLVPRLRTAL